MANINRLTAIKIQSHTIMMVEGDWFSLPGLSSVNHHFISMIKNYFSAGEYETKMSKTTHQIRCGPDLIN